MHDNRDTGPDAQYLTFVEDESDKYCPPGGKRDKEDDTFFFFLNGMSVRRPLTRAEDWAWSLNAFLCPFEEKEK